jgi:hypothetical protein
MYSLFGNIVQLLETCVEHIAYIQVIPLFRQSAPRILAALAASKSQQMLAQEKPV